MTLLSTLSSLLFSKTRQVLPSIQHCVTLNCLLYLLYNLFYTVLLSLPYIVVVVVVVVVIVLRLK